jgi:hypothetical protein
MDAFLRQQFKDWRLVNSVFCRRRTLAGMWIGYASTHLVKCGSWWSYLSGEEQADCWYVCVLLDRQVPCDSLIVVWLLWICLLSWSWRKWKEIVDDWVRLHNSAGDGGSSIISMVASIELHCV